MFLVTTNVSVKRSKKIWGKGLMEERWVVAFSLIMFLMGSWIVWAEPAGECK